MPPKETPISISTAETALEASERRKTENALDSQISEFNTSAIEKLHGVCVVYSDLEGRIVQVNPDFERITGYTAEEAIGQNARILKSGKHSHEFYQEMWRVIRNGQTWNGVFINRKKNGELYHEEAVIGPVNGPSGEAIGYVAVKKDITQKVRAKEKLVKFATTAAHDLRSPLGNIETIVEFIEHDFGGIKGYLSGLKSTTDELLQSIGLVKNQHESLKGLRGNLKIFKSEISDRQDRLSAALENVEKTMQLLSRQARQERALIGKLLEHAMSAEVDETIEEVNLNQIIAEIINSLKIPENIKIKVGNLPIVLANAIQTRSVFANLITNAIKYSGENGQRVLIEIKSKEETDRFYTFFVQDNGIGIPSEYHDKIFESFQTLGSKQEDSTGLGLTTTKDIVERQGGKIKVESEIGKGATFIFTWPKNSLNQELEVGQK